MKILNLSFLLKTNNNNYVNNKTQNRLQLTQQPDTFSRTQPQISPSFTAKEEQISREPLTKLYKEGLDCICCGRKMIDPKIIESMKKNHVFRCSTQDAINMLEPYENNMHAVEKEVFNLIKEQAEIYPDRSIKEHIIELKKTHELPLIQKQVGIFKLIDKYAEKIKPELHKEIREYLLESFDLIKENGNEFSRIRFINNLEKILANYPNTANKERLIRIAGKLPTAYDDKDAFIVKYSKPKYDSESIAIRLLSYSMATIEHIHPQNPDRIIEETKNANIPKGANHLYNYVPECMRCNSFKSNKPMVYQIEDYPEMFINAQKAFDRYIDFANEGKLSKKYVINLYKALRQESEGVLDLDYSRLKLNRDLIKELNKPFTYPVNPNTAEAMNTPEPLPEPQTFPITIKEGEITDIKPIEPEDENQIVNEVLKEEPKAEHIKEEQVYQFSPIISRKKRKRQIAEEHNPQPKPKVIVQKNKKVKENKSTVKRSSIRR